MEKPLQNPRIPDEHGSATQWTSWEGFNHILKGFVDELISIGARPQLKTVTLEIWAKYLSKLEIAFLSKTKRLIPKFGLHQTSKDHSIIGDYIKKNKSSLRRLQKAQASLEAREHNPNRRFKIRRDVFLDVNQDINMEELFSLKKKKRKKMRRRLMKNIEIRIKQIDIPQTDAADELVDQNIKFTQATQTVYMKLLEASNIAKPKQDARSHSDFVKLKFELCDDPTNVTKKKVLAILCMGLFFTKEGFQISDVIRWIWECRVSYLNVFGLLPKEYKLIGEDHLFMKGLLKIRYKSLERSIFHISNLMGITEFPAPDMAALARRFVVELQLPTEVGDHVERLMAYHQIYRCKIMMSYEAIALSFIVVVLKTLFGLDGVTESTLSKFAKEINSLMDNGEESYMGPRLFVWDDWVRYIECRKATISTNHFPTKHQTEKDLTTDAGPYALFSNRVLKKLQHVAGNKHYISSRKAGKKRKILNRTIREAVASLTTQEKIKRAHEFPPSLTPDVSYLNEILTRQTVRNRDVLTYDHTLTSMEFLLEPNKVKEFAQSRGIDVVVKQCPAYQHAYLHYVPISFDRVIKQLSSDACIIDFKDEAFSKIDLPVKLDIPYSRHLRKINSFYYYNDYGDLVKKKVKRRKAENVSSSCLNYSYTTPSTGNGPLTLYLPSSYWVYDMTWKQGELYFDRLVETDFSESFRWLLKECCRILRMEAIDMYKMFRQVEKLCAGEIDATDLKLKYKARYKDKW